jgi:NAD(P)-dependent dehydrogenase (short-subunit alcohol dehydrogenase family)
MVTTIQLAFLLVALIVTGVVSSSSQEYANLRVICVACSSGIGRAAVEVLLEGGASVVVSSRRKEACEDVVKKYPKTGFATACDATRTESIEAVIAASKQFFGKDKPVTTLIWAATGAKLGLFRKDGAKATIEAIKEQMDANVYGLLTAVDALKDDLIATGGDQRLASVLSISSIASKDIIFGLLPYGMGKSAQDFIMEYLAAEFGSAGVRFNTGTKMKLNKKKLFPRH